MEIACHGYALDLAPNGLRSRSTLGATPGPSDVLRKDGVESIGVILLVVRTGIPQTAP